jgi:hypothetical protein
MLEKLLRLYGRRVIRRQIELDLHERHFYWDEPCPMSNQEIRELACVVEARYYLLYLAPEEASVSDSPSSSVLTRSKPHCQKVLEENNTRRTL